MSDDEDTLAESANGAGSALIRFRRHEVDVWAKSHGMLSEPLGLHSVEIYPKARAISWVVLDLMWGRYEVFYASGLEGDFGNFFAWLFAVE